MSYIYEFLIFNGIKSLDYGVRISGGGTFAKPQRSIDTVVIPGRNGTLEIDNKRYDNIQITYPAFVVDHFDPNYEGFAACMLAQKGYQRLEDTYHPDIYRLARYTGGISPKMTTRNKAGSFEITFDCKPQMFIKEGERVIELTSGQKLTNWTNYPAKPLIRVFGTGTIMINDVGLTVTAANTYTDLDCDIGEAFDNTGSRNAYVTNVGSYDYPALDPGESTISWTGFSKVEIQPRWWTI